MLTAAEHHHDSNRAGLVWAGLAGSLGVALVMGAVVLGGPDDPRSVAALRCGTLLVIVAAVLGVALTWVAGRRRPAAAQLPADATEMEVLVAVHNQLALLADRETKVERDVEKQGREVALQGQVLARILAASRSITRVADDQAA